MKIRRCIPGIMLLIMTACIPARLPQQLEATPGPAVVVTDQEVLIGGFATRYPAGWRIITSAADADTPTILLAAPENQALIALGSGDVTTPYLDAQGETRSITRQSSLTPDLVVTAVLVAAAPDWERFAELFEWVIASLRPVQAHRSQPHTATRSESKPPPSDVRGRRRLFSTSAENGR